MIIDAKSIIMTLLIATVAFYVGLKFVRKFALSIAQENHDAVTAMDQADEAKLKKKQRDADAAAASAYAKVEPLITVPPAAFGGGVGSNNNSSRPSSRPSSPPPLSMTGSSTSDTAV
mmetsp:Transcript_23531/g.28272  ORF Transcript_23531/g.28272 Transcript_23531/m.28272 type:complete len:117 (+) Transcript_23531:65-415(+)